jgi:CRISPR-associated endoribonuclease Cas6
MRLMLELEAQSTTEYPFDYRYFVQSAIYSILRQEEEFAGIHDQSGPKPFCFSNIFPYSPIIRKGDRKRILISSPNREIVRCLLRGFLSSPSPSPSSSSSFSSPRRDLRIGTWCTFKIVGAFSFSLAPRCFSSSPVSCVSSTPIVVRLQNDRYWKWKAGTEDDEKQQKKIFIDIVERNMKEKKGVRDFRILDAEFLRMVSIPISVSSGLKVLILGSMWRFDILGDISCLDWGFGERNALGFGFVNLREN